MATEGGAERSVERPSEGEPFEEALAHLSVVHKKEVARLRAQVKTLEKLIRNPRGGGGASNAQPAPLDRSFTLELESAASNASVVSTTAELVETPVDPEPDASPQDAGKQEMDEIDEEIEKLDGVGLGAGVDGHSLPPSRASGNNGFEDARGRIASIEFVNIVPNVLVPNVPDHDDTTDSLFTPIRVSQVTLPEKESNLLGEDGDCKGAGAECGEPEGESNENRLSSALKRQFSRKRSLSKLSKSSKPLQHSSSWSAGTANHPVSPLPSQPQEKVGPYKWQWEHRTGWRDYDKNENLRIEHAYQRGDSKVRLKTGKHGVTPMEIYFVDLIQFDPISGNTRNVKREGHQGACMKLQRYVNEFLRQLETGQPRRESFEHYQRRREAIQEGRTGSEQNINVYDGNRTVCGAWCADVARSSTFFVASMLAVVLNALWIGLEADVNDADSLMDASLGVQLIEYFFCFVFTVELAIRFFAFGKKRNCFKDAWFRFDFTLVVLMLVETVIMPPILKAVGKSGRDTPLFLGSLFRLVRLARLTRLARLLRALPEVLTLLRGILAAMRSVCVTLTLLLGLLFVFGVIFRTQSDTLPDIREQFFPSLSVSMWTLLIRGVFLDTPSTVLDPMRTEGGVVLSLAFIFFIFLSCLTLLNMLIGLFCQVASQVSQKEKDLAEQAFLQTHLLEIMECYDKDNDQCMSLDEFELFMENPDVHEVLKKFGVDPTGIYSLTDVLYHEINSSLSFSDLLEVIMRLRGGSNAHVTDIVELREYMKRRFDRFEEAIHPGGTATRASRMNTSMSRALA